MMKFATFYGTATIAAFEIGIRIFHLCLLPGFGFGDTAQTIVGQNIGAGKYERAKEAGRLNVFYYLLILIILCTFIFIFPDFIVKIFNNEKDVIYIGTILLKFISISGLFLSVIVVLNRVLQGAGDSLTPMLVTGAALYFIQIPLAFILAFKLNFQQIGIWSTYIIANFLQAIIITIIFIRGNWLQKKI